MGTSHSRAPQDPSETVLLPLPGPRESIPVATEYRSTWLASSQEGLRQHGYFERYVTLLRDHRDEVLNAVAGAWVPIAVARAHYDACERLALSPEQQEAMARAGGSVRQTWHATIIAATERPGATIWTILPQLHKLWTRSANGGAVAVYQRGPQNARVEYVGCELFDIPYYRAAVRSVLLLLGQHLHEEMVVLTLPWKTAGCVEYRMQWGKSRREAP